MTEMLKLYEVAQNELDIMIQTTILHEEATGEINPIWRGCIVGEQTMLCLIKNLTYIKPSYCDSDYCD